MDKDKFNKFMNDEARRVMDDFMKKSAKEHFKHEFANFDCATLPTMTNKELAAWQAKHPMDSPQYIIALQEWNRRATAEQTKWMKRSIYIGFAGIVIGAILTAFITWLLPPQKTDNLITPQNQATKTEPEQNTNKIKKQI